jgi:CRP-like cAMP-binding protein
MLQWLGKWLKIYEDEIGLFLWTVAVFILIRSSSTFLTNYAETAFLRRFGVEYLPIVQMANSIFTFFAMALMTGIMGKLPGNRLLSYLFLFCGVSVASLRALIPLGIELIYPVLFLLKSQLEILLVLVFWNLANDFYNTRQSKRLFPLITAGGVLGQIISSFLTPVLVKAVAFDNLLLVYLGTTFLGAVVVNRMGVRFPSLLLLEQKGPKAKKKSSFIDEFKKIAPLVKSSVLMKVLIILTFMPNVIIPIMNYQFNYVVAEQFATEGTMITFFSYFRGSLSIVSLVILLFVGRIYGRWGMPVALMFHPLNYMLAFVAFLLRFDVICAMYARMSTLILRSTINMPANAVIMGLFPESDRNIVRPFLRGTVVRIGLFLGSGLILLTTPLFHPRYLSLVALPFVAVWISAPFILKKHYAKILLDLVSANLLDLKSMEQKEIGQLFLDKKIHTQLIEAFLSAREEDCLWYARLLKSLSIKGLDAHVLNCLKDRDEKTQIALLKLLSSQTGKAALSALKAIADPAKPDLLVAVVQTARRLSLNISKIFDAKVYFASPYPEVKAYAAATLYDHDPATYQEMISNWLDSDNAQDRKAGVIAAMESGQAIFALKLEEMLGAEKSSALLPYILRGIKYIGNKEMNARVAFYLSHESETVRLAALEAFDINGDDALREVINLMNDPFDQVKERAKEKLDRADYQNAQVLIESLTIPRRNIREGVFDLLSSQNIKDLDVYRYARSQVEKGYAYLAKSEALDQFPQSRERDLLKEHFKHKTRLLLENVLRVLAAQDQSGQIKIIWRGIFSADSRQQSNSIEALEDLVDRSLTKVLVPLIEDIPLAEKLSVSQKNFHLPGIDHRSGAFADLLLVEEDWVTAILAMQLLAENDFDRSDKGWVATLTTSDNEHVRAIATSIIAGLDGHAAQGGNHMETQTSITDRILHLRKINLFEGLSVSELAAVASVTEEIIYPPGETVIKEGDRGETMYLIIKGEVVVIKDQGNGREIELDHIAAGDYFGEMALFENVPRSATIRTEKESHLLVLDQMEFSEIVREYPQIALQICKEFSKRLRELHEKIKRYEKQGERKMRGEAEIYHEDSIFDGQTGGDRPGQ